MNYAGVVGLQESHLDALFFEEPFGLGKVKRCMVRRSVPVLRQRLTRQASAYMSDWSLPVGEESYLIRRHVGATRAKLRKIS